MTETTVAKKAKKEEKPKLAIKPPAFETLLIRIVGTAPLVIHRFANKAEIMKKHTEGSQRAKAKDEKPPRDFEEDYQKARHISREGWDGIPASAFRCAMISACKTVGYVMTRAKLAAFVLADGVDAEEGTPLVRIVGTPKQHTAHARNDNGSVDIRIRPMWEEWSANLRIRYDADMFTAEDVANLIMRVGMQVGIGEGRPDSKKSAGLGWGMFSVESVERSPAAQ